MASKPILNTNSKQTAPIRRTVGFLPFAGGLDVTKFLLLVVAYSGVIVLGHWVAYLIRFEFHPAPEDRTFFWLTLRWTIPVELALLFVFGQFRSLLSYFSFPDAKRIVLACAATSCISMGTWYWTGGLHAPPRSIIVLSFLLDTSGLTYVRLIFRVMRLRLKASDVGTNELRRIGIIGAGDVGANLAKELLLRQDLCMEPVAFFDDDSGKWNGRVHGVTVLGPPEMVREGKIALERVIFAMPSATGKRLREIVQYLNEAHIPFETVPSIEQMVSGSVKVSQIRPVEIEDLLGREPVALSAGRIAGLIAGKVVMVTGAGGSIGSELCRQIAAYNPLRILLVERCEVQMFQVEQELLAHGCGSQIIPLVADILDTERMYGIFGRFHPQLVFHAAAHKHVPMMESQPFEAFQNNTLGTKHLANLSVEFGVERFVFVSTDKAINPTNVMGATKRLAEVYLQALAQQQKASLGREGRAANELKEGGADRWKTPSQANRSAGPVAGDEQAFTKFMAVRFGNVLGSSGSVIPTFKKQIAAGGPVTVTHPEITRYFMTVREAVGLVLQSATQGRDGEIFVLEMGKLMRIVDVARQLIELSGLRPDIDVEIKFTGLRPGEKLFEETHHETENMVPTEHAKILRFTGEPPPLDALLQGMQRIKEKATDMDANQIKLEIQRLVPEYRPYLTTV
jgi:FlaA1/EpsC-like NDP-sugar epimerase